MYGRPCTIGRTRLPSLQATPSGWCWSMTVWGLSRWAGRRKRSGSTSPSCRYRRAHGAHGCCRSPVNFAPPSYHEGMPGMRVVLAEDSVLLRQGLVALLTEHPAVARSSRPATSASSAVAAVEARRSIERDLHDGAQQRLATIAVDLGRASRLFDKDPPQVAQHRALPAGPARGGHPRAARPGPRHLPAAARGARARGGAAGCRAPHRPAVYGRRGLPGAALTLGGGGRLLLLYRGHPQRRPPLRRLAHHRAGQRRRRGPGRGLRFSISDDGHGFDPEAVRSAHGLTGMRDRIRAAGGELRIISAPGRGTTVEGRFAPGTQRPADPPSAWPRSLVLWPRRRCGGPNSGGACTTTSSDGRTPATVGAVGHS